MDTLASAFGSVLQERSGPPRIYADANIPAPLVTFMRQKLRWDVFFVLEHDDLRRAPDTEHYRRARDMARTLLSLDRDYFDDRRFPPEQSGGVIVMSAPDERQFTRLLRRIDRLVWRPRAPRQSSALLPLAGQKVHAHPDWPGPDPRP